MADDDTVSFTPTGGVYQNEKQLRHARFLELGGQESVYDRVRKHRGQPLLEDQVTDMHRDLVLDLRGSGLKPEPIAAIMGISRDSLNKLFAYELEVGLAMSESAAATVLMELGLSGDANAALQYLKNHPELKWGTKTQVTGKDGKDLIPEQASQLEANQIFLAEVLTALSTDKGKYKRPKARVEEVAPKVVESSKPKPLKAGATRKKPKGD